MTAHLTTRRTVLAAAVGAIAALGAPGTALAATGRDLDAALRARLGARAASVSVAVLDRRSHVRHVYNPTMTNECASIAKVLLLATLLRTRHRQGRPFSADDRAVARAMICWSDNDAANTVMARAGGIGAVQAMAIDLGMRSTVTSSTGRWGLTTTTAADQLQLLYRLTWDRGPLNGTDRQEIRTLMRQVTPSQRFGVGAVETAGVAVALKNGWLPRPTGAWRHNSIGVVQGGGYDYALAILSRGNATDTAGRALVSDVARVVHARLRTPLR